VERFGLFSQVSVVRSCIVVLLLTVILVPFRSSPVISSDHDTEFNIPLTSPDPTSTKAQTETLVFADPPSLRTVQFTCTLTVDARKNLLVDCFLITLILQGEKSFVFCFKIDLKGDYKQSVA